MTTPKSTCKRAAPKAHYVHRIIASTNEAELNAFALSSHPLIAEAVTTLRLVRRVLCGEAAWDLIARRGLSVTEASSILQVSRSTVRRWLDVAMTYHKAYEEVHPEQPQAAKKPNPLKLVVNNTGDEPV